MQRAKFSFYFTTLTGWLLLCNSAIFLAITIASGSLFSPSEHLLILFGAKDPVSLALGQWWRLVTPLFLHIGLLHFVFNNMALKVIGYQTERLLGYFWFLLIYLGGGVVGNIFSSFSNVSLGAGASGSLFSLIGAGVVIEQFLKREMRMTNTVSMGFWRQIWGPYFSLAFLNILLSVGINFVLNWSDLSKVGIDNMAHLGGLLGGVWLGLTMFYLKKNRFIPRNFIIGCGMIALFLAGVLYGTYKISYTNLIPGKFAEKVLIAEDDVSRYFYLTQILHINPDDKKVRFQRGVILLEHGEFRNAMQDFRKVSDDKSLEMDFYLLIQNLRSSKKFSEASFVESLLREGKVR